MSITFLKVINVFKKVKDGRHCFYVQVFANKLIVVYIGGTILQLRIIVFLLEFISVFWICNYISKKKLKEMCLLT